jgi:hypothetical protein
MYDKWSERKMDALMEARLLVRQLAEPVPAGDSVKAAICRASRKLRWNFSRVRSLWYADPRTKVSADEMTELRQAAKSTKAGATDDLLARLECIEARLNQIDPDFHRAQIDSLRSAVRSLGRSSTS